MKKCVQFYSQICKMAAYLPLGNLLFKKGLKDKIYFFKCKLCSVGTYCRLKGLCCIVRQPKLGLQGNGPYPTW